MQEILHRSLYKEDAKVRRSGLNICPIFQDKVTIHALYFALENRRKVIYTSGRYTYRMSAPLLFIQELVYNGNDIVNYNYYPHLCANTHFR